METKCNSCGKEGVPILKKCDQCGNTNLNIPTWMIVVGAIIVLAIIGSFLPDRQTINVQKKEEIKNESSSNSGSKSASTKGGDFYEVRKPLKNEIEIRTGPGLQYPNDESGTLSQYESIYVLEEKDGWIRFRVTPNDVGWEGWIFKENTQISENTQKQDSDELVLKLISEGLITEIQPTLNEVIVNPATWAQLSYRDKETVGAACAAYCAEKKGTTAVWCDIKDHYTGKKIAKYSQSWGFKVY
ncbi:MAG: hypothetical protein LHW45_06655 [Candidatus Cloacimonetes bacterium]|nr:hypothetical protein [Candidatus Cloacimonadota bacterium]MDY0367291.1 hypothetical protein [Candidatus Syntrophosphaera sp.]